MEFPLKGFIFFLSTFFLQIPSALAFFFEGNLQYATDALTASSGTINVLTSNYEVGIGFSLSKTVSLGWNYGVLSSSNQPAGGTATTLTGSEMGPRVEWQLNHERGWFLAGVYNLIASAVYTPPGGTAETWRGTTMKIEFGIIPPITENFSFGGKLNYYIANYTEKIVNNTTYSQATDSRTHIFPSFSMLLTY